MCVNVCVCVCECVLCVCVVVVSDSESVFGVCPPENSQEKYEEERMPKGMGRFVIQNA